MVVPRWKDGEMNVERPVVFTPEQLAKAVLPPKWKRKSTAAVVALRFAGDDAVVGTVARTGRFAWTAMATCDRNEKPPMVTTEDTLTRSGAEKSAALLVDLLALYVKRGRP